MTTLSQTSTATTILHTFARVRHTLRAFAHGAFLAAAVGCAAGCDEVGEPIGADQIDADSEVLDVDAPHGSPRYVATIAAWDEVICTAGSTARCYAHTPDVEDMWTSVVSWCELQRRLTEGEYAGKSGQWVYTCDNGGYPETFEEYLCFSMISGVDHECFGGSDGWFTRVEPECLTSAFNTAAWSAQSCSNDISCDSNVDSVNIAPSISANYARAVNGDDAFYGMPECALPTGGVPAGNPYEC